MLCYDIQIFREIFGPDFNCAFYCIKSTDVADHWGLAMSLSFLINVWCSDLKLETLQIENGWNPFRTSWQLKQKEKQSPHTTYRLAEEDATHFTRKPPRPDWSLDISKFYDNKTGKYTLTDAVNAASTESETLHVIVMFATWLLKLFKRSAREMKEILTVAATADISGCYFLLGINGKIKLRCGACKASWPWLN